MNRECFVSGVNLEYFGVILCIPKFIEWLSLSNYYVALRIYSVTSNK